MKNNISKPNWQEMPVKDFQMAVKDLIKRHKRSDPSYVIREAMKLKATADAYAEDDDIDEDAAVRIQLMLENLN